MIPADVPPQRWTAPAHIVRGVVEHGEKRGRQLGFPTANIALPETFPAAADGVWAGWVVLPGGRRQAAAISVGTRATYHQDGVRLLEAYLLDFDEDVYGSAVEIVFGEKIRDQVAFTSSESLIDALRSDVAAARDFCADNGATDQR